MANYVKHFQVNDLTIDVRDPESYKMVSDSLFTNTDNKILCVGPAAEFASVNAAINFAIASGWNEVTIFIAQGTYNESIVLMDGALSVNLIGIGAVEITASDPYPNGALYCSNEFRAWNISFRATDVTSPGAYAFHHEQQSADYASSIVFYDCKFYSTVNSAVGLGIGNSAIYFYNCEFSNGDPTKAVFYAHNAASGSGKSGNLLVKDCRVYGILHLDDCEAQYGGANILDCTFINNSGITNFVYYDYVNNYTYFQPIATHYTRLTAESYGNCRTALNYKTKDRESIHYQGISYHTTDCYVPFQNGKMFTNFRVLYSEPAGIVVNSINANKNHNIQLNGTFPAAGTPILLSMECDPC